MLQALQTGPTTLQQLLLTSVERHNKATINTKQTHKSSQAVISYRELLEHAKLAAGFLLKSGYKKGDVIIILQENISEYLNSFWGCIYAGIIPVLLNTETILNNLTKLKTVWKDFEKAPILTSVKLAPMLTKHIPTAHKKIYTSTELLSSIKLKNPTPTKPEETALLFLTSGSTGSSKYVIQTHQSLLSAIIGNIEKNQFSKRDKFFGWLPLGHAAPLILCHLIPTFLGSSQYHVSTSMVIESPSYWLECLSSYQITMSWSPNFAFKLLIDEFDLVKNKNLDLSYMRCLMNGGELITKNTLRKFCQLYRSFNFNEAALKPAFGMAETCSAVTWAELDLNSSQKNTEIEHVPVGSPIPGVSLRIVNSDNRVLPVGAVGCLQVKGAAITIGYLSNKKIIKNDFAPNGWFNTGDLGFIQDGQLYITGRNKDVIVINGEKYFNHEIESVVESILGVSPTFTAACGVRLGEQETEQLAIFLNTKYKGNKELTRLQKKINKTIIKKIGLNPQYIIFLEKKEIPKTDIGKIQRSKLAQKFEEGKFEKYIIKEKQQPIKNNLVPSRDEKVLHDICSKILNSKSISLRKSFFSQGGTSLEAIRLISQLKQRYTINISLEDLFTYDSLIPLLSKIEKKDNKDENKGPNKLKSLPNKISILQKGIWLTSELISGEVYNLSSMIKLFGDLNFTHFESAVDNIISSNHIFSSFYQYNSLTDDVNVNFTKETPRLEFHDLSTCTQTEKKTRSNKVIAETLYDQFDLSSPPLIRAVLIKQEYNRYIFTLAVHHLIFDGYSFEAFYRQLAKEYNSLYLPHTKSSATPIQYTDYMQWLDSEEKKPTPVLKLEYWQEKLNRFIPVDLQTDFNKPNKQSTQCSSVAINIKSELLEKIHVISKKHNVSLYVILLLAYYIVIHYYSNYQENLTISTPISLRNDEVLESILGLMVNTLPLIFSISPKLTLIELLKELKKEFIGLYKNRTVPANKMTEMVSSEYRKSLFSILFTFVQSSISSINMNGVKINRVESDMKHMEHELCLMAYELDDKVDIKLQYNTDLFHHDTALSMINFFKKVLIKLTEDDNTPLHNIHFVDKYIQRPGLGSKNFDTQNNIFNQGIHVTFEQHAVLSPDSVAVEDSNKRLSYWELNNTANSFAQLLIKNKVATGDYIVVYMPRSTDLIVIILAILKVGAIYVPVSTNLPEQRVQLIISDINPKLVITNTCTIFNRFSQSNRIVLDADLEIEKSYQPNPNVNLSGTDPAYVIYTSGTTGTPNGILLNHSTLINLTRWQKTQKGFNNPSCIISQYADIAFDVSLQEIFQALATGSHLIIVPENIKKNMMEFANYIELHKINTLYLPTVILPSFLIEAMNAKLELKCLKNIIISGDVFKPSEIVKSFLMKYSSIVLTNQYGPAETHVITSIQFSESTKTWSSLSNIGSAIDNTMLLICSPGKGLLPPGVPGELFVHSAGMAQGYIKKTNLTSQKFITINDLGLSVSSPDVLFSKKKFYRTGDQVKLLPTGELAFLGRIDKQVKIRGYRVEVCEIESLLANCKEVNESAVNILVDKGEKRLVAFISLKEKNNSEKTMHRIKSFLTSQLPNYAVPSHIIKVCKIPKNTSGKINYQALPATIESLTDKVIPENKLPKSDIEKQLYKIWSSCLNVKAISTDDNFFNLGGDSIACIKFSSIARNSGLFLSPQDIYKFPTIELLTKHTSNLSTTYRKLTKPNKPLVEVETGSYLVNQKLTPVQKGMLFHVMYNENIAQYLTQAHWHYSGHLCKQTLKLSWSLVLENNPALRSNFSWEYNEPIQTVSQKYVIPWIDLDWSKHDKKTITKLKENLLTRDLKRPYLLQKGLLTRFYIIKLEEKNYLFIWNISHLLVDGWSLMLTLKEAHKYYSQSINKNEIQPTPRSKFSEYIKWIYQQPIQDAKKFWQERLIRFSEPTPLKMSLSQPTIHSKTENIFIEEIQFSKNLTQKLVSFSQNNSITASSLFISAWALLLSIYNDDPNVLLGIVNSGRSIPLNGIDEMVGLFINTLPLAIDLNKHESMLALLQYIHKESALIGQYGYLSLKEIQAQSSISSVDALFYSLFIFQNYPLDLKVNERLSVSASRLDIKGATNYPLTLIIYQEEKFRIRASYDASCFNKLTIINMLDHIKNALEWTLDNTYNSPCNIKIFSALDINSISALNKNCQITPSIARGVSTFNLFKKQAQKNKHNIALVFGRKYYSYDSLFRRVDILNRKLENMQVKPGSLVAIIANKTDTFVIAVLAVLACKAVFLPIDADFPLDRIKLFLEDAAPEFLLAENNNQIPSLNNINIIDILNGNLIQTADNEYLSFFKRNQSLAYLIYTSGSTGKPKGVKIKESSLINFLLETKNLFSFREKNTFLSTTSISFDIVLLEILLPLISGGKLVLADKYILSDAHQLTRLIKQHDVQFIQSTPTIWEKIIDYFPKLVHKKMTALCGGETLPPFLAGRILDKGFNLWNLYGPTEATIWATAKKVESINGCSIPIGKPIGLMKAHIFNKKLQAVPVNIPGKLYLSGPGISTGYHNSANLTKSKFLKSFPHMTLYETGDVARLNSNAEIEYLGREDNQVKYNGIRINLEELEAATNQIPEVLATSVIHIKKKLVLFYQTNTTKNINDKVREFLADNFFSAVLPGQIIKLESMPMLNSGKVDKKSLVENSCLKEESKKYVPPKTLKEKIICESISEILGLSRVSMMDDYFIIGGDSIKSLALVHVLKEKGFNLTLEKIFKHPIVTDIINNITTITENNSLPNGCKKLSSEKMLATRDNIFCIHPINGASYWYTEFANYLESYFDIYGLESPGLFDTDNFEYDIKLMAKLYYNKIKKLQPLKNKVSILSWSFGGLIAFELAKLIEMDKKDAFIVIVDPMTPKIFSEFEYVDFLLKSISQDLNDRFCINAAILSYDKKGIVNFIDEVVEQITAGEKSKYSKHQTIKMFQIYKFNLLAALDYKISGKINRLNIIYTSDGPYNKTKNGKFFNFDWTTYSRETINYQVVNGDHYSAFAEKNIHEIADIFINTKQ